MFNSMMNSMDGMMAGMGLLRVLVALMSRALRREARLTRGLSAFRAAQQQAVQDDGIVVLLIVG